MRMLRARADSMHMAATQRPLFYMLGGALCVAVCSVSHVNIPERNAGSGR